VAKKNKESTRIGFSFNSALIENCNSSIGFKFTDRY
jgi:hypothetical protein